MLASLRIDPSPRCSMECTEKSWDLPDLTVFSEGSSSGSKCTVLVCADYCHMIPVFVTHKHTRWPMAYSNPSRQICYYASLFCFSLGECERPEASSLIHLLLDLAETVYSSSFKSGLFSLCLLSSLSRVTRGNLLQLQVVVPFSSHTAFKSSDTDTAGSGRTKHVRPHSSALNSY